MLQRRRKGNPCDRREGRTGERAEGMMESGNETRDQRASKRRSSSSSSILSLAYRLPSEGVEREEANTHTGRTQRRNQRREKRTGKHSERTLLISTRTRREKQKRVYKSKRQAVHELLSLSRSSGCLQESEETGCQGIQFVTTTFGVSVTLLGAGEHPAIEYSGGPQSKPLSPYLHHRI